MTEGFLFTDQYQLAMAQLYFRLGFHEQEVQFEHFFRHYPVYHDQPAGYCINAGLQCLVEWMRATRVRTDEIRALRDRRSPNGDRVFQDDFLDWLSENGAFDCMDLRAIPEGRVIHPNVPVNIVQGPLALCQILETALLNHVNYQILTATKAARIHRAGRGRPLLEFGIRRAQGFGGNAGVRGALIGGADFSSNVGASHALGFPPKGTHAHSMVQFFMAMGMTELDAFRAFADVYPDDCILLVDTVDTLNSGVPNAIKVFEELTDKGHAPKGIRLDSGDLAFLSVQAARMLNDAGFTEPWIVLSNELDEFVIHQIIAQITEESKRLGMDADRLIGRLVYGVGTRLITSWGCPALSAAYKLVGVYRDNDWIPSIKVSDSAAKTPNPGYKNAWRLYDRRGQATADFITLGEEDPSEMDPLVLRHPSEEGVSRTLSREQIGDVQLLLVDVLRQGRLVYGFPSIDECRTRRETDLAQLDPGVKRLINPHVYHVSLSDRLFRLKMDMIQSARKHKE